MAHLIPKSFIQDIVARTDIIHIIGSRLELKKRGNTHTCRCPFHDEKTPSFTVSQSKQFYYCFGCGAHGNVIGFLMEYDRLPFVDAVAHLAQQFGLSIPTEANNEDTEKQRALYSILDQAQKIYQQQLSQSSVATDYLKSRGLSGEITKQFDIGYAPDSWDFLYHSLGTESDAIRALTTAGMLIEKNPEKYYDRFRNRIMFPIRDLRGKTIGFGGRVLNQDLPKYLNSPETPIFHKNQTLYGLYEANQKNRELKRILVVEGYLDVISLAQYGITDVVATLGTALNVKHLQILLRYTNTIIFCFDGDAAGQKAASRALTISLPLLHDGLDFKFLFLPEKEDPDSLIRKIGREAFESHIAKAESLADVFFSQLQSDFPPQTIAGKAAFAKEAHRLLQTMPNGIYQNLMLEKLKQELTLSSEQMSPLNQNQGSKTAPVLKKAMSIRLPKSGERLSPALLAIYLLLQNAALATQAEIFLTTSWHESTSEINLLIELLKYFCEHSSQTLSDLLAEIQDEEKRDVIARIAVYTLPIPTSGMLAEFQGALSRLIEKNEARQLSCLIEKAKTTGLTMEEKQLLKTGLTKNKILI